MPRTIRAAMGGARCTYCGRVFDWPPPLAGLIDRLSELERQVVGLCCSIRCVKGALEVASALEDPTEPSADEAP